MENKRKFAVKKTVPRTQEWNDAMSDLNSMRLSTEEQVKKLNARQSHNLAIAKAELIERNRQRGSPLSFSPTLSAKLRASGSKTVEEVLADGDAAIALAHKLRNEDIGLSDTLTKIDDYFLNQVHPLDECQDQKRYSDDESEEGALDASRIIDFHQQQQKEEAEAKRNELSIVQSGGGGALDLSTGREAANLYPLSPQGWQNLNNTIQLVVKTCEALWQQLEEERMTRERLHFQLQEQRSVITTLTAELLQIQEHQELILRELYNARTSNVSYPPQPPRAALDQLQQQDRFRPPLKGFSDPLSRRDFPPRRSYAYSDSSIETRTSRGEGEHLEQKRQSPLLTEQVFRLGLQGKSKSVTQLNKDDLQDPLQGRFNPAGAGTSLHNAAVIDLIRNFRISEN